MQNYSQSIKEKLQKAALPMWISAVVAFVAYLLTLLIVYVENSSVSCVEGAYCVSKIAWVGVLFAFVPIATLIVGIMLQTLKVFGVVDIIVGACLIALILPIMIYGQVRCQTRYYGKYDPEYILCCQVFNVQGVPGDESTLIYYHAPSGYEKIYVSGLLLEAQVVKYRNYDELKQYFFKNYSSWEKNIPDEITTAVPPMIMPDLEDCEGYHVEYYIVDDTSYACITIEAYDRQKLCVVRYVYYMHIKYFNL